MRIPDPVLAILRAAPAREADYEPAFPLLTVDSAGYPHVALLSRGQLRPGDAGDELLAVVWGAGTRANLAARGRATLLFADHAAAHYLKLDVVRSVERLSRLGLVLAIADYARDSAGVELAPMRFRMSADLAAREGWDDDIAVLDLLAGADERDGG